jgi:hypothetical protein
MSVSKRKHNIDYDIDEDIDEDNNSIIDIRNFDRTTSKRSRINKNEGGFEDEVDICKDCGFGKIIKNSGKICRCVINCNEINFSDDIIKICIFCNDIVSLCECSVILWSLYNCNTCKIAHSVYDDCILDKMCNICEKYSDYTTIGCRCMNGNIKFVNTDIDLRKLGNSTDYADFFEKNEYQPVCQFCECHLSQCSCLKQNEIIDDYEMEDNYEMTEKDYKDEYEQMYYD